ncbi:UMP kinase [Methanohalobium sp.]|uniref:UMP kinase n=1 Tax=Methanohalobium sp. TaxID=2837493 RepID=UPI0025F9EFB4|nr:UMP kinase [Methanohalobium sp.]
MLVVLSIGGSIIANDLDPERFVFYKNALSKLLPDHQLVIVTGGGKAARDYINVARSVGSNEAVCDFIGIEVTRLNAQLLISAFGEDAYPEPPRTYKEAKLALASDKVVVMGGVVPGQTTDAVSAILAEYLNADFLVIATSVDGVYSKDPVQDPNAKRYEKLSAKELVDVVISTEIKAGSKSPVDPLAAKIIERCKMPTTIMDGTDPGQVTDLIMQENLKTEPVTGKHPGTRIICD